MSAKASFESPANIAFVKYWGRRQGPRPRPFNPSISMTLSRCVSRSTVEHVADGEASEVWLARDGALAPAPEKFAAGVLVHLEALASWAGAGGAFRVATENSFPTGAGIASSASGFSALALAAAAALGRPLEGAAAASAVLLGGSGSAARSLLGGFVEWPGGAPVAAGADAPPRQLAPAEHWALVDVVVVVDAGEKAVSSRAGHERAPRSPYFAPRLEALPGRLEATRRAIADRDIEALGAVLEAEAIDLHLIAMSSEPPILYWRPGTIELLQRVPELRRAGLPVFYTIDAGPNVHLVAPAEHEEALVAALAESAPGCPLIVDRVGAGPRRLDRHLF